MLDRQTQGHDESSLTDKGFTNKFLADKQFTHKHK